MCRKVEVNENGSAGNLGEVDESGSAGKRKWNGLRGSVVADEIGRGTREVGSLQSRAACVRAPHLTRTGPHDLQTKDEFVDFWADAKPDSSFHWQIMEELLRRAHKRHLTGVHA